MKLLLLTALLSLSFHNSISFADEPLVLIEASEETPVPNVNLDELQVIFSDLASDLVDNYDYLESGSVNIDQDVTDLDIGKFKFSIDVKTTPLEWETSEEPQTIELSAGMETDVTIDALTSNKVVSLTGFVEIKTGVMPLLKQVAITLGECELIPDDEIIDQEDEIANLICLALMGVSQSTTVKDLKPHLELVVEKAKEIFANQEDVNNALIEVLNALTITETPNGLDISTIIDIDAFNIKTDQLLLSATEDALTLSFSGSANLPEEEFNNYLSQLNEILADILTYEENEDSFYYTIDSYAFIIFDLLEGFLVP